jgi:5-methylcytosine-specific restriction enzyme A
MPTSPLRFCLQPGCPERVKQGRCQRHQSERNIAALSRKDRRYHTEQWTRLSRQRLADYPWCAKCPELAQVTDHVVPTWAAPNLFYEPSNLQSLCHACNRRKAIEDSKRYKGGSF